MSSPTPPNKHLKEPLHSSFAELRLLLTKSPSYGHWRAILQHLLDWPEGEEKEHAIQYAEAHLKEWPDQYRKLWDHYGDTGEYECFQTYHQEPKHHFALRLCRSFSFDGELLGDGFVEYIAENPLFENLTILNLETNELGNDGPIALANGVLHKLKWLDLSDNWLGIEGVKALSKSPHLQDLEYLGLNWNEALKDNGAAYLAAHELPNLRRLSLRNVGITDQGAVHLANSDAFQELTSLDLRENAISNEGAIALSKSHSFPKLQALYLSGNRIGFRGKRALKSSPHLQKVELELSGNNLLSFWSRKFIESIASDV